MPTHDPSLRPITLRTPDGAFIPLRRVDLAVTVDGPAVTTCATVLFHNGSSSVLEADLVLPLPPFAVIQALHVRWGQRALDGTVLPREEARETYVAARSEGRSAVLGEGEGEDLARVRISPVEPGDDVQVNVTLLHDAAPTAEGHRLLVPLTYLPRYVESAATPGETAAAAVDRPRPYEAGARADISVTLRGVTPARVRCASHATQVAAEGEDVVVTLTDVALDRDLALDVLDRPEGALPVATVRVAHGPGPDALGPCVRVTVSPPTFADEGATVPRTVFFLVDRSGSMQGRPIDAAKRAVRGSLRALGPADRFNLIAFDDRLEALARSPLAFDDAALQAADAFADALDARGGTEASQALKAVLTDTLKNVKASLSRRPEVTAGTRLRLVVFMTDGDVADAAAVLKTAGDALRDTRLHVLGIGDAVNHALLAELAELGGGTYTPVSSDEDLERAIHQLKLAMDAPLWTGVTATLLRGGVETALAEAEPARRLDLFAARPVTLAWRGATRPDDTLCLRGTTPDGSVRELRVPLASAREELETHARWAAMRARRLTYRFDPADDDALEQLGIQYGLVTRRTALLAVDPAEPGRVVETSAPVSYPLPRNLDENDLYGALGAMAASAPAPMMAGGGARKKLSARKMLSMVSNFAPSAEAEPYPMMDLMEFERADTGAPTPAPPPAPTTAPDDDTAALRALMLSQRADGMFGDVASTLASVAALVSRGHTHREGDFRAELKRTLATLRGRVAGAQGDEAVWVRLAIALLTTPHGAEPEGLDATLDALARGLTLGDANALRQRVIALLNAAPAGWDVGPAGAVRARFLSA